MVLKEEDPADAKTIKAQFHDFTLPESCARFVTCQDVGKLFGSFQSLSADMDERELRAMTGCNDDAKAILKRCVFVEVREHMIKPEVDNAGIHPAHKKYRIFYDFDVLWLFD